MAEPTAPGIESSQTYPFTFHAPTTIPCACGRRVIVEGTAIPAACVCGRAYRVRLWVDELRPEPAPVPASAGNAPQGCTL